MECTYVWARLTILWIVFAICLLGGDTRISHAQLPNAEVVWGDLKSWIDSSVTSVSASSEIVFDRIIEIVAQADTSRKAILFDNASSYEKSGELQRAITVLHDLEKLEPRNAAVQLSLCRCYRITGNYGKAAHHFQSYRLCPTGTDLVAAQNQESEVLVEYFKKCRNSPDPDERAAAEGMLQSLAYLPLSSQQLLYLEEAQILLQAAESLPGGGATSARCIAAGKAAAKLEQCLAELNAGHGNLQALNLLGKAYESAEDPTNAFRVIELYLAECKRLDLMPEGLTETSVRREILAAQLQANLIAEGDQLLANSKGAEAKEKYLQALALGEQPVIKQKFEEAESLKVVQETTPWQPQQGKYPLKIEVFSKEWDKANVVGRDFEWVGWVGKNFPMLGFNVTHAQAIDGVEVEYMAHLAYVGDINWRKAGTEVKGQPDRQDAIFFGRINPKDAEVVEGVAFRLTGTNASKYRVWYKVRMVPGIESNWQKDGEFCGTRGQTRPIEAIQVIITAKP